MPGQLGAEAGKTKNEKNAEVGELASHQRLHIGRHGLSCNSVHFYFSSFFFCLVCCFAITATQGGILTVLGLMASPQDAVTCSDIGWVYNLILMGIIANTGR